MASSRYDGADLELGWSESDHGSVAGSVNRGSVRRSVAGLLSRFASGDTACLERGDSAAKRQRHLGCRASQGVLEDIGKEMLVGATDEFRLALFANPKFRSGCKVCVATACSGTGVDLLGMTACMAAAHEVFEDIDMQIEHRWSCEIVDWKQDFLIASHNVPHVFRDITQLSGSSAHDVVTDAEVIIPRVDILIAGFSCKDLSDLNNHSAEGGINGDGSTGRTFQGVVNHVERHRPQIVLMENVYNIAKQADDSERDDIVGAKTDSIRQQFAELSYIVHFHKTNARDGGLPQSRPRVYIICYRLCVDEALASLQSAVQHALCDTLDALYDGLGVPDLRPIDDFLDDDVDDGAVRVQTEGNSSCWEIEHSRIFAEHSLEWPVASEVLAAKMGTVHYNRREAELVFFL